MIIELIITILAYGVLTFVLIRWMNKNHKRRMAEMEQFHVKAQQHADEMFQKIKEMRSKKTDVAPIKPQPFINHKLVGVSAYPLCVNDPKHGIVDFGVTFQLFKSFVEKTKGIETEHGILKNDDQCKEIVELIHQLWYQINGFIYSFGIMQNDSHNTIIDEINKMFLFVESKQYSESYMYRRKFDEYATRISQYLPGDPISNAEFLELLENFQPQQLNTSMKILMFKIHIDIYFRIKMIHTCLYNGWID